MALLENNIISSFPKIKISMKNSEFMGTEPTLAIDKLKFME